MAGIIIRIARRMELLNVRGVLGGGMTVCETYLRSPTWVVRETEVGPANGMRRLRISSSCSHSKAGSYGGSTSRHFLQWDLFQPL